MDACLKLEINEEFSGLLFAYQPVIRNGVISLGIAVANQAGYSPVAIEFDSYLEAVNEAEKLNKEGGFDKDMADQIIISSMAQGAVKETDNAKACA